MKIKFKKLDKRAVSPVFSSADAAGADLRVVLDDSVTIMPSQSMQLRTGLAVAIPKGYVGLVYARSGIACKRDLAPSNKVGVIDADYRGEIMISLHNHGDEPQTIKPNERVAQLVVMPYLVCKYEEVKELGETERGSNGFGSTGRV